MSTLKADTVTTKSDNTDLTITGGGTGVPNLEAGFKVSGSAGVPTASIQDDAVTLAKLASGTDGELITWDASGDPAVVAVGTATNVLTSNGAGAAPTFQAAGGGAWNLLSTITATTSSTVDFEGLIDGTYENYVLVGSQLIISSSGYIRLIVGTGATPTYQTGSVYQFHMAHPSSSSTSYAARADTSDTDLQTLPNVEAGEVGAFQWTVYAPADTGVYTLFNMAGVQIDSSGYCLHVTVGGAYNATTAVTAIRIEPNSGTITGVFKLYGIS